jgi:hypothetical protein
MPTFEAASVMSLNMFFAGITVCDCYARTAGSLGGDLYGQFSTTCESLRPVGFLAAPGGWNCQLPGLVYQNCWLSTKREKSSGERVCSAGLLFVSFNIFVYISCGPSVPQELGIQLSQPADRDTGARFTYDGALPGVLKG